MPIWLTGSNVVGLIVVFTMPIVLKLFYARPLFMHVSFVLFQYALYQLVTLLKGVTIIDECVLSW